MTSATSPKQRQAWAEQAVERFVYRFGQAHGLLACHAALPLVLTPELVNYLRTHFLHGEVPWEAEVDLLLSELCRPVGYELYVMDTDIRNHLLQQMEQDPNLGTTRIEAVARLLISYVRYLYRANPALQAQELATQQWAAMVFLDDQRAEAADQIAAAFERAISPERSNRGQSLIDPAEMARLSKLTQAFARQLQADKYYHDLVRYAKLVGQVLRSPNQITDRNLLYQTYQVGERLLPALNDFLPDNNIEVFFSYAHEDEQLRDKLAKQLKLLERQGVITAWYDRDISAGTEWANQIDQHLETAKVILLLISDDFVASDYCYDIEMKRAMERHAKGEACVIPVILRQVDNWQSAPFGKLQALPKDAKPVTNWDNLDEAFEDVARGIRKVVERWQRVVQLELEQQQAASQGELINPFQFGNPLRLKRAHLFKGRQAFADQIVRLVLDRSRPTLVLHGPRRCGKSSFLLNLPRLLPSDMLPVYLDMQSAAVTSSEAAFCQGLVRAIHRDSRSQGIEFPAIPQRQAFLDSPYVVLEDWLEEALPKLGGRRILLNLDEFEKIGAAIKAGKITEDLLNELRHLIQHYDDLGFLFSGVQTLDELAPHWSDYFISVVPIEMLYLEPNEARELLEDPDPAFTLRYDTGVVDKILDLTRCQPYLLQLIGSALVTQANLGHTQRVTSDLLQAAIQQAFTEGEPYFTNVWTEFTGKTPDERAVGQQLLKTLAADQQPDSDDENAQAALRYMLRHHMIERLGSHYRIEIPLIAMWVRERAGLD